MRRLAFTCVAFASLAFAGGAAASDPIIIAATGNEGCVSPSGDT